MITFTIDDLYTANSIDSRDIIDRIEALEIFDRTNAENEELTLLEHIVSQADSSPDWQYGETLISDQYFASYTKELIKDCYDLPKEFNSDKWPWKHLIFDYETAAEELKQDYFTVKGGDRVFWIRR